MASIALHAHGALPKSAFTRVLETCKSDDFFRFSPVFGVKSSFKKDIKTIRPNELNQILNNLCINSKDPLKTFHDLAEALPLEQLRKAIKQQHPAYIDAIRTAKQMLHASKHYLEKTDTSFSPSLKARWNSIFDKLIAAFESILAAFGVAHFFKPVRYESEAEFKTMKITGLVYFASFISTLALPLLGAVTGGIVIGVTFLSIALLSLVYPLFKPAPSHLP